MASIGEGLCAVMASTCGLGRAITSNCLTLGPRVAVIGTGLTSADRAMSGMFVVQMRGRRGRGRVIWGAEQAPRGLILPKRTKPNCAAFAPPSLAALTATAMLRGPRGLLLDI